MHVAAKRRPRRMANKRLDPLEHPRPHQADMATPSEAVVKALEQRVEKALARQDLQAIDSSMDALFVRLERSRSRTGHRRQQRIEKIERYEHELEHVVENHETKRRAHLTRANTAIHELVLQLRTSQEPNEDSETAMEALLQTAEREYRLAHDTRSHSTKNLLHHEPWVQYLTRWCLCRAGIIAWTLFATRSKRRG